MQNPVALTRRTFMLTSVAALAACKPAAKVLEVKGLTMGTSYTVVALDPSRSVEESAVKSAISTALAQVNAQMSNWDSASEISRFNAQTGAVEMSEDLARVMNAAAEVNTASQGRFDTTMGPLIELWGFGAKGAATLPSDAAIRTAQARSGHEATLEVAGTQLRKRQSDAQVYLAAIGKGYGADKVGKALEALGLTSYMVEIGGDLYASGLNPSGTPWQIGIEKPAALSGGVMEVIGVSGYGLASSGDYRNYFEKDGARYSHIIDPATGRPITHKTASATVLAENAMLADAWSTAMLILGREKGLALAEEQSLAVLFVERDTAAADLRFKSEASSRFSALTA